MVSKILVPINLFPQFQIICRSYFFKYIYIIYIYDYIKSNNLENPDRTILEQREYFFNVNVNYTNNSVDYFYYPCTYQKSLYPKL